MKRSDPEQQTESTESTRRALERISYRPGGPINYRPRIGLIGCGGITRHHLRAYRAGGWEVAALCDLNRDVAEERREEFYPDALVFTDHRQLLGDETIDVIDLATHPTERPPLIEAALRAGKHVLSQKPFVLDLDEGLRLCDLADSQQRLLAVNQNARWAPHFRYAEQVIAAGLIGRVHGAHLSVHWDHSWVAGTPFEDVKHLILYDYAIHWFDILACLGLGACQRVFASHARTASQSIRPPLLGQALLEFEHGQATLAFDAHTPIGSQDRTFISGSRGSIRSTGPGNQAQTLEVAVEGFQWRPNLRGSWFPDGFQGTMSELLRAIEQHRRPSIDARQNLDSLALCFAAVASAETGRPMRPGDVRRLPE